MYLRSMARPVRDALTDTPVVLLCGARQTGKTTLVRSLAAERGWPEGRYATLDDLEVRAAASADPAGFLAGLATRGEPVLLDEVQRAPDLLPAIKASVDRDRRPGRFLLTGSANVLVLPTVSESLAGRVEIVTLWPLAQSEIAGRAGASRTDGLFFAEEPPTVTAAGAEPADRAEVARRVLAGGYPEPLARASEDRRQDWFASYLTTLLQRDVRDIARVEGLTQMPRLLALLASRAGSLLNAADISRTADIPYTTLQRYLSLLEATYLVRPLPAWSSNLGSRLIKSPKVLLADTGLAAHLMGLSAERVERDPGLLGGVLENFVAMEAIKDAGWSRTKPGVYHWHTTKRDEVDLLLEARDGRLVGIEVKASGSVSGDAFKGLRALKASVPPDRFVRGIVFYTGAQVVPFAEDLFAVPLSALWSGTAAP